MDHASRCGRKGTCSETGGLSAESLSPPDCGWPSQPFPGFLPLRVSGIPKVCSVTLGTVSALFNKPLPLPVPSAVTVRWRTEIARRVKEMGIREWRPYLKQGRGGEGLELSWRWMAGDFPIMYTSDQGWLACRRLTPLSFWHLSICTRYGYSILELAVLTGLFSFHDHPFFTLQPFWRQS
jgi:hypothetical protein